MVKDIKEIVKDWLIVCNRNWNKALDNVLEELEKKFISYNYKKVRNMLILYFDEFKITISVGYKNNQGIFSQSWLAFLPGKLTPSKGIYPLLVFDVEKNCLFLCYGVSVSETMEDAQKLLEELMEDYGGIYRKISEIKEEISGNNNGEIKKEKCECLEGSSILEIQLYEKSYLRKCMKLNFSGQIAEDEEILKQLEEEALFLELSVVMLEIINILYHSSKDDNKKHVYEEQFKGYIDSMKKNKICFRGNLIPKLGERLNHLADVCFSGVMIDKLILKSFFNSLKSKGFVILAGLSGTGKTKIFEEFTDCLEGAKKLFFPIRPEYKDSKSLIGFYNPITREYHITPLIKFIVDASREYLLRGENADPYFVLLDEMNLARVEYYFSDFLSILETRRFGSKEEAVLNENFLSYVKNICGESELDDKNYVGFTSHGIKLHSDSSYEGMAEELFLPPNLYFVGTVNIDETTYMFSPKVLDRAFTIEFDVDDLESYFAFIKNRCSLKPSESSDEEIKDALFEFFRYCLKRDFVNDGKFLFRKDFMEKIGPEEEEILEKLNKINRILKKYGFHFGYRVVNDILAFLYASKRSVLPFRDYKEAFDLSIKMKVLPKIHGTSLRIKDLIVDLVVDQFVDEDSRTYEELKRLIVNLKEIPQIEREERKVKIGNDTIKTSYIFTVQKLLEMYFKLKTQGFASYI